MMGIQVKTLLRQIVIRICVVMFFVFVSSLYAKATNAQTCPTCVKNPIPKTGTQVCTPTTTDPTSCSYSVAPAAWSAGEYVGQYSQAQDVGTGVTTRHYYEAYYLKSGFHVVKSAWYSKGILTPITVTQAEMISACNTCAANGWGCGGSAIPFGFTHHIEYSSTCGVVTHYACSGSTPHCVWPEDSGGTTCGTNINISVGAWGTSYTVNCPAYCGDGKVSTGEQCDDGNRTDGDGCSSTCTKPATCDAVCTLAIGCNGGYTCSLVSGLYRCRNATCPTDSNCDCFTCGDGSCNGGETCSTCPGDCTYTNGTCGTAHTKSYYKNTSPAALDAATRGSDTLCSTGTVPPDPSTTTSTWNWACTPSGTDPTCGTTANCSATRQYCGDGAVNGTEQCDAGASNGVVCSPPYGGTCNYCSTSCTTQTVTGLYCGDGTCSATENCSTCPSDCAPVCGSCGCESAYGETCSTCPGDCTFTNGVCGTASGRTFYNTASPALLNAATRGIYTLCSAGTTPPDPSTTTSTWNWTCTGTGATCAINANCSATRQYCGDGATNGSEQCDAGGNNGVVCSPPYNGSCTYCSTTCTTQTLTGGSCGDGTCSATENCSTCPSDCAPVCGSCGCESAYGETCSTCAGDCGACATCGNGIIEIGEECDDNNMINDDGCSYPGCQKPDTCNAVCVSSIGCDGFTCNGTRCRNNTCSSETDCICPRCGDGNVDLGEECDDGGTVDGDGCSATCTKPASCGAQCSMAIGCGGSYSCYAGATPTECRNSSCTTEADCICRYSKCGTEMTSCWSSDGVNCDSFCQYASYTSQNLRTTCASQVCSNSTYRWRTATNQIPTPVGSTNYGGGVGAVYTTNFSCGIISRYRIISPGGTCGQDTECNPSAGENCYVLNPASTSQTITARKYRQILPTAGTCVSFAAGTYALSSGYMQLTCTEQSISGEQPVFSGSADVYSGSGSCSTDGSGSCSKLTGAGNYFTESGTGVCSTTTACPAGGVYYNTATACSWISVNAATCSRIPRVTGSEPDECSIPAHCSSTPWFKATDGHIYAKGSITDDTPAGEVVVSDSSDDDVSYDVTDKRGGMVCTTTSSISTNMGKVSERESDGSDIGWNALNFGDIKTGKGEEYSYDWFVQRFGGYTRVITDPLDIPTQFAQCLNPDPEYCVIRTEGIDPMQMSILNYQLINVAWNFNLVPIRIVFFIDGDLYIGPKPAWVPIPGVMGTGNYVPISPDGPFPVNDSECGSNGENCINYFKPHVAYIVKGTIHIDPSVRNIYGLFYSEGGIDDGSKLVPSGVSPFYTFTPETNVDNLRNKLWIFGSIVSSGPINLRREVNFSQPNASAEQVVINPAYYFTLSKEWLLGEYNYRWEE